MPGPKPRRKLAVLACMDARLDLFPMLGLDPGDAHLVRNAGGLATDDAIRSLALSQHLLGTERIVVVQHTDCGLLRITDEEFERRMVSASGQRPDWRAHAFTDLDANLRGTVEQLRTSPFLLHHDVTGFVFEVESGELREVVPGPAAAADR